MIRLEAHKAELMQRKLELTQRLTSIESELDIPHSRDWEEDALMREGDEVLENLGSAGLAELERINAALGRIAEGTYGTCLKCGDEISDARLSAVPEAPLCRTCANTA